MALEEVSFYTVTGDEINITNLVNQMINFYLLKLEVGETVISDFNEGSEIRNFIEALSVGLYGLLEEETEIAKTPFITLSYGQWLDRIGELPFLNMPRIEGKEASGNLKFILSSEQNVDVVIPSQTVVVDSSTGLQFLTDGDCVISAGLLEGNTHGTCVSLGIEGNSLAGKIDTIDEEDIDTELISVTNPFAFEGGQDEEDDEDYRERLLTEYRSDGFGSEPYYINLGKKVNGVHDVLLVPSNNTNYTKNIIVNGFNKPTPDSVLIDVLKVFTDKQNIVLNHNFTVSKPVYTTINLVVNVDVKTEIDEDILEGVLKLFVDGGEGYEFEFTGLYINDSLSKSQLISVLETFEDIVQVTSITSNNTEITTISPSINGVIKIGELTFNQNVVN